MTYDIVFPGERINWRWSKLHKFLLRYLNIQIQKAQTNLTMDISGLRKLSADSGIMVEATTLVKMLEGELAPN